MTLTITMRKTLDHFCKKIALDVREEMAASLRKHGTQRLPHRAAFWTSRFLSERQRRRNADFYRYRCQNAARAGVCSWEDVLLEEVYEALAEDDLTARRAELVQVMNVCALEIEQIDEELASG